MHTPEQLFGELFTDVQLSGIFPDSKTFVDCTPNGPAEDILTAYRAEKQKTGFDLKKFVLANFSLPLMHSTDFAGDPSRPIEEHIDELWNVLLREADVAEPGSSLIPLPYPYVVPGGRFGEIYYWDSYFTMLGLLTSGRDDIVRSMLENFTYLIETVGHIPNGNRTYFLSRSQPPFFACMVREAAVFTEDTSLYEKYAGAVEREYSFWMDFSELTAVDNAWRRTVEVKPGMFLNRYWDDLAIPRAESYVEDVELAKQSSRDAESLFRDIRAACESGWDFSARWFDDPMQMSTIRTTAILPVDLNCLLWSVENFLAKCYAHDERGSRYEHQANHRSKLIREFFWHAEAKTFRDWNFKKGKHTDVDSVAMMFPLFVGIATHEEAEGVANAIQSLLKSGGLVSTALHTGQQWDAPNGWAPLQWVAIQGLRNYGFNTLANEISGRWINNVLRVYRNTAKLVEKYNVEDITLDAGGGEYPVQDGFGWTNGVMRRIMEHRAEDIEDKA